MKVLRVGDEQVEFGRPELVDLGLQCAQTVGPDPVDPLTPDFLGVDKSGVDEQQQMLGDRRSSHGEVVGNLADRERTRSEQLQDASPGGLGSSGQGVGHD